MLKKYRVTMKEGLAYVLAVVITVASCLIGIPVKAQTGDPLLEKIEGIVLDNNVLQGASIISSACMPATADVVAALYDSSTGALEDVDIVTQAVLARDGTEQTVPFSNRISYSSGKAIKIFVWDHINTMKPLVGTYVYPNLRPAFYVATNGSDSASGTIDAPFATLGKARDAMRNSTTIKTTYVRGGTYKLTAQLDLTSGDHDTSYIAYPGEVPVISGGEEVNGFASEGNGIYSVSVPGGSTELEVFVDGERQHPAQKWNLNTADPFRRESWRLCDSDGNVPTRFKFHDNDIEAGDIVSGAKIEVFEHWSRQFNAIVGISNVDLNTKTVTLSANAHSNIVNYGSYRILNNPAFIDQSGEFAWRASDNKLVIKLDDPTMLLSRGAVVPRLSTLISAVNADHLWIEGLTFSNAVWQGGAVSLEYCDYNTIKDNKFINVGKAVSLLASTHNVVTENDMESLGSSGVYMASETSGSVRTHCDDNSISYNYIHNIGAWETHCGGVFLTGRRNTIAHNDIENCSRYGISLKDWNTDTPINDNIIEYNKVWRTNRTSSDTGAIETLGRSYTDTNIIIRYNDIEDSGGLGVNWNVEGGDAAAAYLDDHVYSYGVYLDDQSSGVQVYGNLFKDIGNSQVYIHAGKDNVISNNFMILANPNFRTDYGDLGENAVRTERSTDNSISPMNNSIHHNIIYGVIGFDTEENDYWLKLDSDTRNTYDYNCLYRVPKFNAYSGQDTHSSTADPLFNDESAGDYRLKTGSPALTLGIVDLPWSLMGRTGIVLPDMSENVRPQPVLNENFDDIMADHFNTIGGIWTLNGGKYQQTSTAAGAFFSYYSKGFDWTDYMVSADVKTYGGILFRFKDANNYYLFRQYSNTQYKLDKKVNGGNPSTVTTITKSAVTGSTYNLKVRVSGNNITLYIDGSQVWNGTDSSIASGTVGVYTSYNTSEFDNVMVNGL